MLPDGTYCTIRIMAFGCSESSPVTLLLLISRESMLIFFSELCGAGEIIIILYLIETNNDTIKDLQISKSSRA